MVKTRENIFSSDYALLYVPPGALYNPSEMRAMGAGSPLSSSVKREQKGKSKTDGYSKIEPPVLFTTELGLTRKTSRVASGTDNSETGSKLDIEVISKAAVVFNYELEGF